MTNIMQNPGVSSAVALSSGSGVARSNLYTASTVMNSGNSINQNSLYLPSVNTSQQMVSAKRSLNRDARKKQLLKITMEN